MKILTLFIKLASAIDYAYPTLIVITILLLILYKSELFYRYDELINAFIQITFKS